MENGDCDTPVPPDTPAPLGTPARLAVGIISAGRVGTALGQALEAAGHVVAAATAPSLTSQRRLAARLPDAQRADPATVARRSELLVLAVPDTALPDVVAELAAADAVNSGHIVVHTAGALGANVLHPFYRRGAVVAAIHPAMTFTGEPTDVHKLTGAGWAVTASSEIGHAVAHTLVLELGGHPVTIAESHRGLYHAALAHGANHLVTLVADACAALAAAIGTSPRVDTPDPDGLVATLLGPLARAALDNALARGDDALTGPVMRSDIATVRRHLDTLDALDPGIAAAYRDAARRTAIKLRERGGGGGAVLRILDGE